MYIKYIILVGLVYLKLIGHVQSDCVLSLKTDLPSPQPVFLKYDGFLAPNGAEGGMLLKRGASVVAACPGRTENSNYVLLNNRTTGNNSVELECVSNRTFRGAGWTGAFVNVTCNVSPWFIGEITGTRCYSDSYIVRVSYEVKKKFHVLYEACFDNATLNTLYVKDYVDPSNIYTQNVRRPNFVEGSLFGKIRLNKLYTLKKQKERFSQILGGNAAEKYLSKSDSLTRGHLAAKADFNLEFSQRASFHLVNVAPQWRRGNQGDWAALESALRQRVNKYGKKVAVYTGTYGVASLKEANGRSRDMYLYSDENGNDVLPVPMYFYKVVHDVQQKSATAFVSINNPYISDSDVEKLMFCEDVCRGNPNFKWLTWRANDGTTSFCCEFRDFNRTIKHLSMLKVDNLFY